MFRASSIKTSKYLLIVLEIQVGQDLVLLALALVLYSSTCIKIKNEIYNNYCTKIK
jgi:hypothetical protein